MDAAIIYSSVCLLLLSKYLLFSRRTHCCYERKVLEIIRHFSCDQFEMQYVIFHDPGNQRRTLFSKQKSLNNFSSDKGTQVIAFVRYINDCNILYLINLTEVTLISEIVENQVVHTKPIKFLNGSIFLVNTNLSFELLLKCKRKDLARSKLRI